MSLVLFGVYLADEVLCGATDASVFTYGSRTVVIIPWLRNHHTSMEYDIVSLLTISVTPF